MNSIEVSYLVHIDNISVWARAEIYENELELYSITNMDDVDMIEYFNDWFIDRVRFEAVQQAFEDGVLEEEYPDKQYGEL
jgi:hypothetical protein